MGRVEDAVERRSEPTTAEGISASYRAVAGVLLAAGTSSRFTDGNKLLANVDGEPMVRRAVTSLVEATTDPVLVVVGHDADAVRHALDGIGVELVTNPGYRAGQSTSVRRGIEAVSGRAEAVVFALGDMPYVDPASVDAIVDAYRSGVSDAIAAAHDGKRGNPVLFDAAYFDELARTEGDTGGRAVIRRDGTLVETADPGVRQDIDRRSDFET